VSVKELEDAVQRLSPADLDQFREWFAEFDAAVWDRQMEEDVAAGRSTRWQTKPSMISAPAVALSGDPPGRSALLAILLATSGRRPAPG